MRWILTEDKFWRVQMSLENLLSNDLLFHDGLLHEVHFCLGRKKEKTVLDMDLYKTYQDPKRVRFRFTVSKPARVILALDYDEHRKRQFAGVISDGTFIKGEDFDCLRLYICGGYIEFTGKKINAKEI